MHRHIGLLALFTAAAFGQLDRAVPGAPYSAEQVNEDVQTLADGTHITHKLTIKIYRDSAGRTRTERTIASKAKQDDADGPRPIEIVDPVANARYSLNPKQKVAHKWAIPAPRNQPTQRRAPDTEAAQAAKPVQAQNPLGPEVKTDSLGSQTMEGLMVDGERRTTTWPAGSPMGNDRPVTVVREAWTSPDLHLVVLLKYSDPLTGEHTEKLVNVNRAEPDSSLFQLPGDYRVEEHQPLHR
jgi:hypothetical protein